MLVDDSRLLCAYVTERSEEAFREIVRRHITIVHGVAQRQAGVDPHLAYDVTQRVFIALARKAPELREQTSIVGWLYTAARLEAMRAARSEARRRSREEKVSHMKDSDAPDPASDASWEQLKPVMDDAMAQLGESDRVAVLLRFFSGHSFGEVGCVLQISEEAARKRVDRAVERLRAILGRRGITSTSSALCSALGAYASPRMGEDALATIVAAAWQQVPVSSTLQLGLLMSSIKLNVTLAGAIILFAGAWIARDVSRVRAAEAALATAESERMTAGRRHETAQRGLAAVQQQKVDADARERGLIATTPNPLRPYLQDPEYRALAYTASLARRHLEFQRLYRRLGLSPEQITRFEHIMARQDQANLDGQLARDLGRDEQAVYRQSGPEWNSAMRELLGKDGMKQLQDYLRSMAVRNFIDSIAAKSYETGVPITLEQTDRLTALALTHDPLYQQGKGTDPGKVSWNDVWEPAAKLLSPEQVAVFETAVEVWSLQKRISLSRRTQPTR